MKYLKLDNKEVLPIINFGTYQIRDLEKCEELVLAALEAGYRGIDTAQAYFNEEAVGNALAKTSVPRNEIFLTTKVIIWNYGYQKTIDSINESLKKLKTDYVDLVLIHQPFGNYYEAYRALEDLQDQGLIKYIGVSNFYPDRLADLALFSRKVPQVNQIEINPFFQQKEAIEVNKKYLVSPQAWAPFAEGRNDIFNNEILKEIGEKYNKKPAQVILRWLVEQNISFDVKSSSVERIRENFNIFDFSLSQEDMDKIATIDTGKTCFFRHDSLEGVELMHNLVKSRLENNN